MEYLIGSLVTLLCFIIFNKFINKINNKKIPVPMITQSRQFLIIKNYLIFNKKRKDFIGNQSKNSLSQKGTRVFFLKNEAYWIEDGFLVTAEANGKIINKKTQKRVDTHSMSALELNMISFIVDKLTKGNDNDSGNSGNKEF